MKTILNTILFAILVFSCKAQTIIVPIGSGQQYDNNPNYYLKDTNNEFSKFEGTWVYNNESKEIILKLKKEKNYQATNNGSYQDLLVGEYKYQHNNLVVTNTLNDFDNQLISGYEHHISGYNFKHQLPDNCIDNSNPSEIKISLNISQPNNKDIEGRMILRYVNDNGIEKIQACIYDYTTLAYGPNDRITIPDGYYEFIKQD